MGNVLQVDESIYTVNMPAKKEMSFLPEEEDINSLSSRILRWLTTVGRFVIVFTELIVISAFLSRFWLDRTNSDLSEVIRQQKAILDSTADFEKEYSLLQKRLKIIKSFYQNQPNYQQKLEELIQSTPEDIFYNSLSITQAPDTKNIRANVNLYAYQETSVVDFITNLLVNPKISTVEINTIEKKPRDNKYIVELSLVFAKDK